MERASQQFLSWASQQNKWGGFISRPVLGHVWNILLARIFTKLGSLVLAIFAGTNKFIIATEVRGMTVAKLNTRYFL